MIILHGKYKNKTIFFDGDEKTKPTKSIVKKSLFEKIRKEIVNRKCLDLFSGTGALGFESVSLGASEVYFNDLSNKSIKNIIRTSSKILCGKKCKIHFFKKDFFFFLKKKIIFDIIYIDPPYFMFEKIISNIKKIVSILKKNGIIYFETRNIIVKEIENCKIFFEKKIGKTKYFLFRKN